MSEAAATPARARRHWRIAAVVLVMAVAVAAASLPPARRAPAPGSSGSGVEGRVGGLANGAAPSALQAQAATGGAIAGRWAPPAPGSTVTSYDVRVVRAANGRAVAATRVWSPSAVVGGLGVGGRYRLVVAPTGGATAAISAPVLVLPDLAPDAPSAVTAGQIPGTNGLQVRWAPAASGVAATGALVQLYAGLAYQGYLRCQAECTMATFRGLRYGGRYTVWVVPTNGAGNGQAIQARPVDLLDSCPTVAACVTIDAAATTGPARLRAQGFLNSLYPVGAMIARTQALTPQSWRGAPTFHATGALDWSSWDAAVLTGAQTTMLLSSLWHSETTTGAGARPPWANWAAYSAWVTATVRSIEASGHRVTYWEIQNEPGSASYFSAADWAAATVAEYLQQFWVAYQAIKAADPNAQVVGPSLSHFADYPGEYDPHEPDLVTFLDFAAGHGMHLAAVTWHEIDDSLGAQPHDYNLLPQTIGDHVAEARQLIAERPALGHPQVWINEYGRHANYAIPGWTLGDIAAIEGASVDRAGRSCWTEQGAGGISSDDCASPTLDGLLAPDGTTPRADYWVYATYARMTGRLVAAATSDATLSVLAVRNDAASHVVAMLGRHVSCLPGVNLSCQEPAAAAVPPVPVTVDVHVPWVGLSAEVTIARVSPTWAAMPAPATIFQGPVSVTNAIVTISLPSVADGEVYLVTIGR